MIRRCHNPKDRNYKNYKNYGGRGIAVAPEWKDVPGALENYVQYVEALPSFPGYDKLNRNWQLDRIDNDGNYEPGNVRWLTVKENLANTRNTHLDELRDALDDAADTVGLPQSLSVHDIPARLAAMIAELQEERETLLDKVSRLGDCDAHHYHMKGE